MRSLSPLPALAACPTGLCAGRPECSQKQCGACKLTSCRLLSFPFFSLIPAGQPPWLLWQPIRPNSQMASTFSERRDSQMGDTTVPGVGIRGTVGPALVPSPSTGTGPAARPHVSFSWESLISLMLQLAPPRWESSQVLSCAVSQGPREMRLQSPPGSWLDHTAFSLPLLMTGSELVQRCRPGSGSLP